MANKNKFLNYETELFVIKIPSNWSVEISDFIYSFYDPNGFGTLQLSTYKKDKNFISIDLVEELKRFLKINNFKNYNLKKGSKNNYNYVETEFIKNYFFSKIRLLSKEDMIILITYNCKEKSKNVNEVSQVNQIFNSFKLKKFKTNYKVAKKT